MNQHEPIAILGMACRFPGGATSLETLWTMLLAETDAVRPIPPERWNHGNIQREGGYLAGWVEAHEAGLLEDPTLFDPAFFGISAREAAVMDPQQRILLECAYEALEDGGLALESLRDQHVGVFVGACNKDYATLQDLATSDGGMVAGNAPSMLANRISYSFDLRGPSWVIDTACSSSLSALHAACQSLRQGEIDVAVVGTVNLLFSVKEFVFFSNAGMLSPDGRCRAFDRDGQGYVRAEGAAALVLKRASQAGEDRVLAHLLATGANQDGHSAALTQPSLESQAALLRQVYGRAGLEPDQISYMEAHGTGTPVGDPVEATSIGQVLGQGRQRPLPIGSIKTNVGHLEGASGFAGLFKAVLVCRHGLIPPSLHCPNPHPDIDFQGLGIEVPRGPRAVELPAVVGVNSFGLGGANAHVVVATAPPAGPAPDAGSGPWLLPVSARSRESYRERLRQIRGLAERGERLGDLCHMASARSTQHPYRAAALVGPGRRVELSETPRTASEPGPLVFVFCGQGAIWWKTGRDLLASEPVFRQTLEECDALARGLGDWSILEELSRPQAESRLDNTGVSQPVLFAVQMGLVRLLASWGIQPAAVLGHSAGAPAALCCSGMLSLHEAFRFSYHRGRLMDVYAPRGRMLAVQGVDRLEELTDVVTAAYNGPQSVVLSGPAGALDDYAQRLAARGLYCRALNVDLCFHHPGLEPMAGPFRQAIGSLQVDEPRCRVMSTVLADWLEPEELLRDYGWRTVREPVRFHQAVDRLLQEGFRDFLEIGAHPVLTSALHETAEARQQKISVSPTLVRNRAERETLLEAVARLYERGHELRWAAINPRGAWMDLPAYPWSHQSFWAEGAESRWFRFGETRHPLLGRRRDEPRPRWTQLMDARAFPFLTEHRLGAAPLMAGATFLAMAVAAGRELFDHSGLVLDNVRILETCFFEDEEKRELSTLFDPASGHLEIRSEAGLHYTARLLERPQPESRRDLEAIRARCPRRYDHAQFRAARPTEFVQTGSFDCLREVLKGDGEVLAFVDGSHPRPDGCLFHPGMLDSCVQATNLVTGPGTWFPIQISRVRFHRPHAGDGVAHLRIRHQNERNIVLDLCLCDPDGRAILELEGYCVQGLQLTGSTSDCVTTDWMEQEPPPAASRSEFVTLAGALGSPRGKALAGRGTAGAGHVLYLADDRHGLEGLLPQVATAARLTVAGSQGGPMWGWVRSVMNEHPHLRARLIDCEDPELLWQEATSDSPETEVRYRDGQRQVARLRRCTLAELQAKSVYPSRAGQAYRLQPDASGRLDSLAPVPISVTALAADEVRVQVEACALNFADSMKALNLLPGLEGKPRLLGGEAAGTVTAVGSGVTEVVVGDRVMSVGAAAMGSLHSARYFEKTPWSAEESAGMPVVFMTALYALEDLARLQPGERVLVHSAAGGLGLAALQVARSLGAEVVATAGTPEKRAWLQSELGLERVFDSRGPHWMEEIRQAYPDGLDVVLNSLAGPAIEGGLDLLRPYGRFLEVGKRDLWEGNSLALRPFRHNLSYFAIDLEAALTDRPALIRGLLARVAEGMRSGRFQALPTTVFPFARYEDAFRLMSSGQHKGKLILRPDDQPLTVRPSTRVGALCDPQATYLVTGGTQGAGLAAARWLARQGARHLLLVSRGGRLAEPFPEAECRAVDVSDRAALEALLDAIPAERPLRGVIHAAGRIEDGLVAEQTPAMLARVLAGKAEGARHLHDLIGEVDFFVLFSSIASLLGSPGQSAYAAANAALDALARERHARGLPALSIQWPALRGFGYLRQHPELDVYLERGGVLPLDLAEFEHHLEAAMRSGVPEVGILRLNAQGASRLPSLPKFSLLKAEGKGDASRSGGSPRQRLLETPPAERQAVAAELAATQIARILRVDKERLDYDRRLLELGLDSLMSLELRNWVQDALGVSLTGAETLRLPSLDELARVVVERLGTAESEREGRSDDEVDARLAELLGSPP